MPATLTIRDEALGGESLHEWVLEVLTERLTIRELFRSRVYQEVQDYNRRRCEQFVGLVRPDEPTEATLNRPKTPKAHRPIDWKRQYDRALEAFEKNQVLVLMDDRQAESLDEEVVIGPKTTVTFLRLMPLIGG